MNSSSEPHITDALLLAGDTPLYSKSGPRAITLQAGKESRLVFLTEPASLAVEQYKMMRRRLCAQHPRGGILLITSPSPGEGKTLTSINLSWCLAEGGHETCLVDFDFRSPGVSAALGCSFEDNCVEDVLTGKRTIMQSMRQLGDRPLYVLGIRERLNSPAQLLASSHMSPLINDLRAMFQWVILDLPPAIPMADVAEVLPHVDGALMVVRSGKTDRAMVAPPLEILGSKLWGVVLNDSPVNGSSYYGYYGDRKK